MTPSSLLLRNYRSFAGPERLVLELRPLTLLFGRNNAGKSSLVRCLPLLGDSIGHQGLDALDLEGRLKSFDLDFDSLRWKGRAEADEPTLGLGVRWNDAPRIREVEWALREEDAWHRIVVQRIAVRGPDDRNLLTAEWRMTRGEEDENTLTYDVQDGVGTTWQDKIEFRGLLPVTQSTSPAAELIGEMADQLRELSRSVLWLHSLRPAPERYTRWRGAVRWSLTPSGQDAPIVLAGERDIRKEVSDWYMQHLGCELVVDESRKREVRTLLRNRFRTGYDVDLIDTGEGVGECLPVLTALAMARHHQERGGPSLVVIEEPGSHLHPDLQRALVQRACEVAASAKPRIILETHSEHALLTARLNVVKGLLHPTDVILYWVRQLDDGRSIVAPVELDEDGRFRGDWPPDVFQQDIALAAEIQDARDQRAP